MENRKRNIIPILLLVLALVICILDISRNPNKNTNSQVSIQQNSNDNIENSTTGTYATSKRTIINAEGTKNHSLNSDNGNNANIEINQETNNTVYYIPPVTYNEQKTPEERIQDFERRIKEEEQRRIEERQRKLDLLEDKEVVLRCENDWECTLSPDKLTMKYGRAGASSNALATRHYKTGKYYFEVEFKMLPNGKHSPFNNIGIAADKGFRFCTLNDVDSKQRPDRCPAYGIFRFGTQIYDGDVIGLAIDLDNGKLNYTINNVWNVGIPGEMKDGIPIQKGLEYTAAFEVGHDSYYNVNFGSKPFKYEIPKGYRAYNQKITGKSDYTNKINYDTHKNEESVLTCRNEWECSLSPDNLTMKNGKSGPSSRTIASKYHKNGKYYLEVEYKHQSDVQTSPFNNIGIVADKGFRSCFLRYGNSAQNPDNCPAFGVFKFNEKLKDGDIIGLAIDLDNGKLTYSINNVWNVGITSEMGDGIPIEKGFEYTAAFEVGRNSYYNVNFGSKPFKYKIPQGYKAYNAN